LSALHSLKVGLACAGEGGTERGGGGVGREGEREIARGKEANYIAHFKTWLNFFPRSSRHKKFKLVCI